MTSLYTHVPHPHLARRASLRPVRVADQHAAGSAVARFNARLAVAITNGVGTMWTAYLFTLLAFVSLPAILTQANMVGAGTFPRWLISVSLISLVAWIAQTFLQLVLLPVIIVGQNVQAGAADRRSEQTFLDAEAIIQAAAQIAEHLTAQDEHLVGQDTKLADLIARLQAPEGGS